MLVRGRDGAVCWGFGCPPAHTWINANQYRLIRFPVASDAPSSGCTRRPTVSDRRGGSWRRSCWHAPSDAPRDRHLVAASMPAWQIQILNFAVDSPGPVVTPITLWLLPTGKETIFESFVHRDSMRRCVKRSVEHVVNQVRFPGKFRTRAWRVPVCAPYCLKSILWCFWCGFWVIGVGLVWCPTQGEGGYPGGGRRAVVNRGHCPRVPDKFLLEFTDCMEGADSGDVAFLCCRIPPSPPPSNQG